MAIKDDYLKLRVPKSKKDKKWYKYQADRLVPAQNVAVIEDYEEMNKLYQFMNNDLSGFTDEIKYYCGSLAEFGATEEDLIPYNPIPNKIEVLKGDMLARGVNFRVMLLTAKAIHSKNREFVNQIQASVNQELQLAIEEQKAMMQGMSEQEAQQYIQSLRTEIEPQNLKKKNFLSHSEILYSKLLQYTLITQDVKTKMLETLEDCSLVSRGFLYCGWKNGKPVIDVLNPLHVGFHKAPNEPYIQKGDCVWYRDEITIADALQQYSNKLDEEGISKLIQFGKAINPVTGDHMSEPVFDQTQYYSLLSVLGERVNRGQGLHQGNSLTNVNLHRTLWRTHVEFKAFDEVIFLTYTDDFGEKITVTLDAGADIIPEDASKVEFTNRYNNPSEKYVWDVDGSEYEAEILWIPRRYEFTRLEPDILIDYRPVPLQPDYGVHVFDRFELSYKGGIIMNRNAKWVSLVTRSLPYAFQYMAVKRLEDREMAGYIGQEKVIDTDQVAGELAIDHAQNPEVEQDAALKQEIIAQKTKTRFISSSRSVNGMPIPTTRGAGVSYNLVDATPQLLNLEQLSQMIDVKVGLRMGIAPQRESMVAPNTTATDNRQALIQSNIATLPIMYYLDKIWSHAIDEHLRNLVMQADIHFSDPDQLSFDLDYILPDGSKEFLSVKPEDMEHMQDLGLYLYDSGKEKFYFDSMMQNAFSIAQNGGRGAETVSSVLKALTSTNSVEEAHSIITDAVSKMQSEEQQLQQQQQQLQEQMKQAAMELERYRAELKLEGDLTRERERRITSVQTAQIQAESLAAQYDINENKESDLIEKAREDRAFEREENQKNRELQLTLKNKELASKEKIEKSKNVNKSKG